MRTSTTRPPRINYVCTVWSGRRRAHWQQARNYLPFHIETLTTLPHNLAQITFVINQSPNTDPASYSDGSLPSQIQDTPVRYIFRPNKGLSYGALNAAFVQYPDFDYYIFMEDDFVFVQPDFDMTLLNLFSHFRDTTYPNLGWLCGRLGFISENYLGWHAANSCGLILGDALKDLTKHGDPLPNSGIEGYANEPQGQVWLSKRFFELGYTIWDYRDFYKQPMLVNIPDNPIIYEFNHTKEDYFIVPVQLLNDSNPDIVNAPHMDEDGAYVRWLQKRISEGLPA